MEKAFLAIAFLFINSSVEAGPREISKAFETDVCTAWIDGTKNYDWSHCCIMHDLRLWVGGQKPHRVRADKELKSCVREAANEFYADIMYFGVRLGSMSPYKIEGKGWGNAWKKNQRYTKPSREEIMLINWHLRDSSIPELEKVSIDEFINELYVINGL